jgi:hypothetical protein
MAGVAYNGRSYTMGFGKSTEGFPIVELGRGGAVARVVLDNLDKGYHTYELEFNPADNAAKLVVDGKVRAENYSGYDEILHNVGDIYFGSTASEDTGRANYALVKFEVVRQP